LEFCRTDAAGPAATAAFIPMRHDDEAKARP
jgi:hypothetical protein